MVNLEHLPHPDYLPYPSHYTAAFFANRSDAEKVITELESLGWDDEDFNVFEGEQGLKAVDVDGTHHTLLERYLRRFVKFSDSAEWRFLNEADIEIKNGHILICIHTPDENRKQEVATIAKKYGAYDIRYFTPIYVEEMK